MSMELSLGRLLGFDDFFPSDSKMPKEFYAKQIGKDMLYNFCLHFLSFFRLNAVPPHEELFAMWFTFEDIMYYQVPYYHYVAEKYAQLSDRGRNNNLKILSVESCLKLFIWLSERQDIPEDVPNPNYKVTISLFQLYLLFNQDVLANYDIATRSIASFNDNQQTQRSILAMSFPQHDFLNADYAQLVFTQFYKAIKLLEFISASHDFHGLHDKLLLEYDCASKEEYFRSIGLAAVLCLKNTEPTWTVLQVSGDNIEKQCAFLEKICFTETDPKLYEQNDYLSLRSNPLQKVRNGEYRVIYDLFLIKKVYTGLVFKLSEFARNDNTLIEKDFLGTLRNEFSEGVLLYEILNSIYAKTKGVRITGNEFKTAGLKREPDFYLREGNTVLLFESKDFFIPGDVKLSYDFIKIEAALKNNRLEKAVVQLLQNTKRTILKQLILDSAYDTASINIYPIIIVHDALYSTPALNFWVHYWFEDGLEELKKEAELKPFDFSRISPVTLIEIDTLILYEEHFGNGELDVINLISDYHSYVRFRKETFLNPTDILNHAMKSAIPFSEFARDQGFKKNIVLNMDKLFQMFHKFGIR